MENLIDKSEDNSIIMNKVYKKYMKKFKKIIKEDLIFAISVKVIILLLSVFGLANMWFAVFADTGVTLLAILNTLRITNKFRIEKDN